jgi:hypothetical protein
MRERLGSLAVPPFEAAERLTVPDPERSLKRRLSEARLTGGSMSQVRRRQFLIATGALLRRDATAQRAGGVACRYSGDRKSPCLRCLYRGVASAATSMARTSSWRSAVQANSTASDAAAELVGWWTSSSPAAPKRRLGRSPGDTTVPIVIVAIDYDPIASGYVNSLARPSGNVTGVFLQQIELPQSGWGLSRNVRS